MRRSRGCCRRSCRARKGSGPTRHSGPSWIYVYTALAGACDALTGALLLGAPDLTLRLMGVTEPPAEPIYLRFVGAFVAGVGLTYWVPVLRRRSTRANAWLASALGLTAVVRASVGAFVAVAVAGGWLSRPWSSVAITDLGLAVFQLALLARGVLDHD